MDFFSAGFDEFEPLSLLLLELELLELELVELDEDESLLGALSADCAFL